MLVATAAFASSFVQAEDKLVTAQNEQVKFSELITKLDSDKMAYYLNQKPKQVKIKCYKAISRKWI